MGLANRDDDRLEIVESAVLHDDLERALDHKLDRIAPSRRAVWPKDDRRSSERISSPSGPRRHSGDPPVAEPPLH